MDTSIILYMSILYPNVHFTNVNDIPNNPVKIIQNVATKPPTAIAIATPAMFPKPTVPETAPR